MLAVNRADVALVELLVQAGVNLEQVAALPCLASPVLHPTSRPASRRCLLPLAARHLLPRVARWRIPAAVWGASIRNG
jgi:hypothetical protein